MPLNLPANRMELMTRKRRLVQAVKGLKMLKDKLEAIMVEFLHLASDYKKRKQGLWEKLLLAQARYALAASAFPELLQRGLTPCDNLTLSRSEYRVMTLILPKITIDHFEPDTAIPPQAATIQAIQAIDSYKKLLPDVIAVAELETTLRELALEVQRTRRRVNALEHVLIPRLTEEVKSIQSKLDEYERGTKSRLLRVKDMLQKKSRL